MSNYYDRDSQPISRDQWVRAYEQDDRKIGSTKLDDDVHVSTVWLGINHNFGDGPPLIFETIIFGGPLDEQQWRYSTEAEARAGHEAAVTQARAAQEAE